MRRIPGIYPDHVVVLHVVNTLDQDVTINIMGNHTESTSNAAELDGSPVTVSASSTELITLNPLYTDWMPYLFLKLTCSTAPTTGYVTVTAVYNREYKTTVVNAIKIRDTSTHTPDTDPDKIQIFEW